MFFDNRRFADAEVCSIISSPRTDYLEFIFVAFSKRFVCCRNMCYKVVDALTNACMYWFCLERATQKCGRPTFLTGANTELELGGQWCILMAKLLWQAVICRCVIK